MGLTGTFAKQIKQVKSAGNKYGDGQGYQLRDVLMAVQRIEARGASSPRIESSNACAFIGSS
jgi:hypothetical protein